MLPLNCGFWRSYSCPPPILANAFATVLYNFGRVLGIYVDYLPSLRSVNLLVFSVRLIYMGDPCKVRDPLLRPSDKLNTHLGLGVLYLEDVCT